MTTPPNFTDLHPVPRPRFGGNRRSILRGGRIDLVTLRFHIKTFEQSLLTLTWKTSRIFGSITSIDLWTSIGTETPEAEAICCLQFPAAKLKTKCFAFGHQCNEGLAQGAGLQEISEKTILAAGGLVIQTVLVNWTNIWYQILLLNYIWIYLDVYMEMLPFA